jgi:hypothetical protein
MSDYISPAGAYVTPTAADSYIGSVTDQVIQSLGVTENYGDVGFNVASQVLNTPIDSLYYMDTRTKNADGTEIPGTRMYSTASELNAKYHDEDASHQESLIAAAGWNRVPRSSRNQAFIDAANKILNKPPPTPNPPEDKKTEITPTPTPPGKSARGIGIYTLTLLDGIDVSSDVESIRTNQPSTARNGNEKASCEIVLCNIGLKYLTEILPKPKETKVSIWFYNDRNMVSGNTVTKELSRYNGFYGIVSEVESNDRYCKLKCEDCSASYSETPLEDVRFPADMKLPDRVKEILTLNDLEQIPTIRQETTGEDVPNESVQIATKPSDEMISNEVSMMGYEWFPPSDMWNTILIVDGKYALSEIYLDPYVIEPGDGKTLKGYANDVDGTGDADNPASNTDGKIPAAQGIHTPVMSKDDINSITDGGWYDLKIPGKLMQDSNISQTKYHVDKVANTLVYYRQFIDANMQVQVLGIVPMLCQIVRYTIPNLRLLGQDIVEMAKVTNKSVEYSSAGLIANLDCQRWVLNDQPNTCEEPKETEMTKLTGTYTELINKPTSETGYAIFGGTGFVTERFYYKDLTTGQYYVNTRGYVGIKGTMTETGWQPISADSMSELVKAQVDEMQAQAEYKYANEMLDYAQKKAAYDACMANLKPSIGMIEGF